MNTKVINLIKEIVTRYYPKDRELKGNEFERGKQSLAIEIADVIDPINEDNTKPSASVDIGDILFKGVMPAKPKNVLGAAKNPTMCLQNDSCSIVLLNVPFEDGMDEDFYEVIIRRVERPKVEEKPVKARHRFKAGKKREDEEFWDFAVKNNVRVEMPEFRFINPFNGY